MSGLEERFDRAAEFITHIAAEALAPGALDDVSGCRVRLVDERDVQRDAQRDVVMMHACRLAVLQAERVMKAEAEGNDVGIDRTQEKEMPTGESELGSLLLMSDGTVGRLLSGVHADWAAVLVSAFVQRSLGLGSVDSVANPVFNADADMAPAKNTSSASNFKWLLAVFLELSLQHGRHVYWDELVEGQFSLADKDERNEAVDALLNELQKERGKAVTNVAEALQSQGVSAPCKQTVLSWLSAFLKVPDFTLSAANISRVCALVDAICWSDDRENLFSTLASLCTHHSANLLTVHPQLLSDVVEWDRQNAPQGLKAAHLVDIFAICSNCADPRLRAQLVSPVVQCADVWAVVKMALAAHGNGAHHKEALFLLDAVINNNDSISRDPRWSVFIRCFKELQGMYSASLKRTWKEITMIDPGDTGSIRQQQAYSGEEASVSKAESFDRSWLELLLREAFHHPNTEFRAFALASFLDARQMKTSKVTKGKKQERQHVEYSLELFVDSIASLDNLEMSLATQSPNSFNAFVCAVFNSARNNRTRGDSGSARLSFRGGFETLLGRALILVASGMDSHERGSRLLDALLALDPALLAVAEIGAASAIDACTCLESLAVLEQRDPIFRAVAGGTRRKIAYLLCACCPDQEWRNQDFTADVGRLSRLSTRKNDAYTLRGFRKWALQFGANASRISALVADHRLGQAEWYVPADLAQTWALLGHVDSSNGEENIIDDTDQTHVLLTWCRAWSDSVAAERSQHQRGLISWFISSLRLVANRDNTSASTFECNAPSRAAFMQCLQSQPVVHELCSWSRKNALAHGDVVASLLCELKCLCEQAPSLIAGNLSEVTACVSFVIERMFSMHFSENEANAGAEGLWTAATLFVRHCRLPSGSCDALVAASFPDDAGTHPQKYVCGGLLANNMVLCQAQFLEAASAVEGKPTVLIAACLQILRMPPSPSSSTRAVRSRAHAAAIRALGKLNGHLDTFWWYLSSNSSNIAADACGNSSSADESVVIAAGAAEELTLAAVRCVFTSERCANPNAKPELQRFWDLLIVSRPLRVVLVRHLLFSALAGITDPGVIDLWVPELTELLLFPANNVYGIKKHDTAMGDLSDLGTYTRYLALYFCESCAASGRSWIAALIAATTPFVATNSPKQVSALEAVCILCRALDSLTLEHSAELRVQLFVTLIDNGSLNSFKGEALERYYLELAVTQLLWGDPALLVPPLLAMLRKPGYVDIEKEMSVILILSSTVHHWRLADSVFWRATLEDVVVTLLPYLSSATVQGREFSQVLIHFLMSSELAIVHGEDKDGDTPTLTPGAARVRALPEVDAVLAHIAGSRVAQLGIARISKRLGNYNPPQRCTVQHLFSFLVSRHARSSWLEAWFQNDTRDVESGCDREAGDNNQNLMVPTPALLESHRLDPSGSNGVATSIPPPVHEAIVLASLVEKVPNVGGLTRTCEMMSLKELVLSDTNFAKEKQFKEIAASADLWCHTVQLAFTDIPRYMRRVKALGYRIVVLEQSASSVCVTKYKFPQDGKVVFLLGTEKQGVPSYLLNAMTEQHNMNSSPLVDDCVEIPQFGFTRSLNVHCSAAILCYEYIKQQHSCTA